MTTELSEREYERMLDTIRTASEWHSGQWSALYSYSSTGHIHTEEHQNDLLREIDRCLETQTEDDNGALEHLRYTVQCWPAEAV